MKFIKAKGIVLKDVNFEESSKILTILTSELGKIQALSKNCRRTLSPLSAVSQPLIYSEFVFTKTKEIYSISSASVIESFFDITQNVYLTIYSSYLIELVDSFIQIEQKNEDVLRLLLNSLYMLKKGADPETICRIFEIKMLIFTGFFPQFTQCVKCQKSHLSRIFFSFKNAGVVCAECKEENDVEIGLEVVEKVLTIAATDLKKLSKIRISKGLNDILKTLMTTYIKLVLQKDVKILDFFKFIK
ncbi:DNA repair protein RecO [Caldicellulosiruptor changbaiensis]|uniref:DNA repair protein RecO n=1 Tax=Caldicellulosiruptor changbaiensis TaxID=1222016 RepID=A0A3T0D5E8_9FIRM|nr:DNA repair protein RecO [Caldicellulosiruptor changbaiensis]AZT90297.1 DNA repair protein RecO [Caldicellulosiruptor changbaiensis]